MKKLSTRLIGFSEDLIFHFCQRNLKETGKWLAQTMFTFFYRNIEYRVLVRPLMNSIHLLETKIDLNYRLAKSHDLMELRNIVLPSELKHFEKRLSSGRTCLLAIHNDRLIAYAWATDKIDLNIDNLILRLKRGDVYIDDNYTLPMYRGKGIQTALHLRLLKYMQERNFKRAIVIVATNNFPSLRMVKKIGYQEVDWLYFRRIFVKRVYHYQEGKF